MQRADEAGHQGQDRTHRQTHPRRCVDWRGAEKQCREHDAGRLPRQAGYALEAAGRPAAFKGRGQEQAGRDLVPTPRALALRERVGLLVQDAQAVLRPVEALDPGRLRRVFTLRTAEGFVETFGPVLIARVAAAAPGVLLRFVQKPDKDSKPLRDGAIDLETGVVEGDTGPERHTRGLREGLVSFGLPMQVPEFAVSLLWHPRMEADPAHRWLRGCVREACSD